MYLKSVAIGILTISATEKIFFFQFKTLFSRKYRMPVSAFILSLFLPLWDLKSSHYIRKFFITNFVIMIKVCRDLIRILPQTQENFAISKFVINQLYCTIYNHLLQFHSNNTQLLQPLYQESKSHFFG